jgi:hypothetical protein
MAKGGNWAWGRSCRIVRRLIPAPGPHRRAPISQEIIVPQVMKSLKNQSKHKFNKGSLSRNEPIAAACGGLEERLGHIRMTT